MQNNLEIVSPAALAFTGNDVIIRKVFSFCTDPLVFLQVCAAFRNTISSYDSRRWVSSVSAERCEAGFELGYISPTAKYIWSLKNCPGIERMVESWRNNALYSFFLTERVRPSEEVSLCPGAAISLAAKYNNIEYLDACELVDDVSSFEAWDEVRTRRLIDLFVSLIASPDPSVKIVVMIANVLYRNGANHYNVAEKMKEKSVSSKKVMSLFEPLLYGGADRHVTAPIAISFLKQSIFAKDGLNACLLMDGIYAPEELSRIAMPILNYMFFQGYEPEFKSVKDMNNAYDFYNEMKMVSLYGVPETDEADEE